MSYRAKMEMWASIAPGKAGIVRVSDLLPIVYKQPWKAKIWVLKKLGIRGFIKLYLFERKETLKKTNRTSRTTNRAELT